MRSGTVDGAALTKAVGVFAGKGCGDAAAGPQDGAASVQAQEVEGSATAAQGDAPLLDAIDLAFGYGAQRVWEHVDLTLYPGEVGYLVGYNGAGKTTLLKCVAGWLAPSHGEILIDGHRLTGRDGSLRRQIAFVGDVPAFFEDLTAREHIDFILKANRADERARREARQLLESFGIEGFCDAYPAEFSRGMRQKLALTIALMVHPRLLLLDEPTGPLDPASRELLGELVAKTVERGAAVLLSAHHGLPGVEPDVVYQLGDGRLEEVDGAQALALLSPEEASHAAR